MLLAELPPLAAGDYVDSLVLIGAPQMQQVPGVANPLLLRTPVVRTSYRHLYVYAWWSEAFAFTQDASGDVVDLGSSVSVSPGWYEIDDQIIENSGSRWLLASPATIPSGNGPFAQTLVPTSSAASFYVDRVGFRD